MKHLVVALIVATAGRAHADELTATLGQPVFEVSHTVDIRIADGVATYRVRRQFANPGKVADEASLAIDLPYGAAATGLRIRARDRWYDGELLERTRAAALYHELTGLGAWQPRDPALLQWQWADKLHLQVFPVMPGQVSTVEYTLTVPTRYTSGRYWVSYPRVAAGGNASPPPAGGPPREVTPSLRTGIDRSGSGPEARQLATPTVTVHPAWGDATTRIAIDGKPAASDTPVVLALPPHAPWQDAVHAEAGASYVASTLDVPASSHTTRPIASLVLTLDVAHTYKSDLQIELMTPRGQVLPVHEGTGGDANGVRGSFTLALPPGTVGAGTWQLVVSDHAALDTGAIDGWSIAFGAGADATTAQASDTPVFIPDAPETASDAGVAAIAIAPPAIATWTARFGRVVASDRHAFARLEIDVAPQLSALPKRAQVVFIVDASFSVGAPLLAAQLAVIRAYLSHLPDAEVEVITARRHATRVFGRFVSVPAALAGLASPQAFALGNGSAIDDAARLATTALADRVGPRRIIVTTDELFRDPLVPDRALAAFARISPDTVVHVVVPEPSDDRVALAPADDERYAALATRHHGLHLQLRGASPEAAKALAPVVLELVRPTRIGHLTVAGMATDVTELREGEGLRLFAGVTRAPRELAIAGTLWSDPIRRSLAPLPGFSRQTAAFVFGADEHQELSPAEMMTVALLGRAVSPVTSYVAAEPGTRPSTIGLPEERRGAGSGGGTAGGMLGGVVNGELRAPDLRSMIDTAACLRQVQPAAHWRVVLDVETTRDEIVDVTGGADPMAACLIETTWRVRLDAARFPWLRAHHTVELGG